MNEAVRSQKAQIHIRAAAAVFLSKLAKHLALIACLMLLGRAAGRFTIGPLAILSLTVFASIAHLAARALSLRLPDNPFKIPPTPVSGSAPRTAIMKTASTASATGV